MQRFDPPSNTPSGWAEAVRWGYGAALIQRVLLGIWMALIWQIAGPYFGARPDFQVPASAQLPQLSGAESLIFGVWRHWDAIHYLNLAQQGYSSADAGMSVFPPLTAWSIRAFDLLLPGGVDLAGMVTSTLMFGLALTLLYRLCATYYDDSALPRWAVVVMALLPLGHFFAAPMSESLYLALTLATIYAAFRRRWWLAGIAGFLATLTRTQGVLLLPVAGLFLLQDCLSSETTWKARIQRLLLGGYPLALILLGVVAFTVFRTALHAPPLDQVYKEISYLTFVDPLTGLWVNLRWLWTIHDLSNVDAWAVVATLLLTALLILQERKRHLPLTIYTVTSLFLFVSKINYAYGTNIITHTQSFGRYALMLFPLTILMARFLEQGGRWRRIVGVFALLILTMMLSARHVLGLLGP